MAKMGVSTHGCGGAALRPYSFAIAASSSSSSAVGAPTCSLWFASSLRRCSVVGSFQWRTDGSPVNASQGQEFYRFQRKNGYHSSAGSSGFGASRQTSFNTYPATGFMHETSSVDETSKCMWTEEGLRLKFQKVREHICTHYSQSGLQDGGSKYKQGGEAYVIRSATNDGGCDTPYHSSVTESLSYTRVAGDSIKSSSKIFEAPLPNLPMKLKPPLPRLNIRQPESPVLDIKKQSNFAKPSSNGLSMKDAHSNRTSISKQENQNSSKTTRTTEGTVEVGNQEKLSRIYDRVLVVDNTSTAKEVVRLLTSKYKNLIHACDTEVANIDVKLETPVGHGDIICFSIYSGPLADFGDGKSCIWVDILDGGRDLLMEFASFFEDPNIKKVWHNYSFDCHVIEKCGIKLSGFHADTMHLARLWDSSRRVDGGYSLEALTGDRKVMSGAGSRNEMPGANLCPVDELISGKISMKSIFGKKKLKKDGSEGKLVTMAPVEVLQREERKPWVCYSALDSISTLKLFNSLKAKLENMEWILDGCVKRGTMYDFYEEFWRPFGVLLAKMETHGMLVDRVYLSSMEKIAIAEQKVAADKFRKWASKYCPDAKYMNVGSDTQIRQLLFGGTPNRKDHNEFLPEVKRFKVPNTEKVIEEGKKTPSKYRTIELKRICDTMEIDMCTANGWPSVGGDALKGFAGKVSADQIYLIDDDFDQNDSAEENLMQVTEENKDISAYGTAYYAFGGGKEGKEACHAIAALCEVCSIDSLISNFLLPLQGNHVSCSNGRIHCSLNINTETGRLSARRPNLQNQPALEKDRYKIRQAFIAAPGNSLIVADYGQLELRILAHLANCKSMLDAFKAGGDFHSRTAMNMYEHIRRAVEEKKVLLEWHPQPGEKEPPAPLLKDAFAAERRKAKMLNFSIAYGKTSVGLSRDWKVSVKEAKETVDRWYRERKEVRRWQEERKAEAREKQRVWTLLGRSRVFPSIDKASNAQKAHIERAAINTPVQGSAADVAMCAMLEIDRNTRLKELGWRLLLQVHDEVILEGPTETAEIAKDIVVECMSKPFYGTNFLKVGLAVDAKCAKNWYAAK